MINKEVFWPIEKTSLPKNEAWLLDSYSFNNGFWHDKKTFQTTITDQQGRKRYHQTDQWEIRHQGETIAQATSCVLSDTGLPWVKINLAPQITPEQRQALEASLKYYGAVKEK